MEIAALVLAAHVATSTPTVSHEDLFRRCVASLEVCTVRHDQLQLELRAIPTSTVAYTPPLPTPWLRRPGWGAVLISGLFGVSLGAVSVLLLTSL